MAYLKRLELHGFKSFAQRCALEFSPGITAIVGPNGSGKCLLGSSLVTLADGRDIPIKTLVDEALQKAQLVERLDDGELTRDNPHGIMVLSLNPDTLKLEQRPVQAFVRRTAPAQLLRIRTRSGREVTITPYHPLFTLKQGKLHALKAEELRVGVRIAAAHCLPTARLGHGIDFLQLLRSFSEEDRVYIPNSPAVQKWAGITHTVLRTWKQWATIAKVPQTQLKGLLDGQSVNASVLVRLADAIGAFPPLTRQLKSHGSTIIQVPAELSPDLARFLGLIIAEGRTTAGGNVWFVNTDFQVNDEYVRLVRSLFGIDVFRGHYANKTARKEVEDCIVFSYALGKTLERLFGYAINSKSATKHIPPQVFSANAEIQWAFLSGLLEGDGHIHVTNTKRGTKTQAYIEYVSASSQLARDVVAMLLRLGIFATLRVREKWATNTVEKRRRNYYAVYIYGASQLRHAAQSLYFIGQKQQALEKLLQLIGSSNPNQDLIPGATTLVREAVKLAKVNVKRYRKGRAKLAAYNEERCEASRGGLLEVAQQIENVGAKPECASAHLQQLRILATSDVYWDEIVSVEQIEPPEPWVYDLCISETHNFVADTLIVHNSNVADAIRWVLGEQSMRQLRGKKSDDIIFAGGASRAAAQMAQVGLVLDNSAAWLPSEFSEVTVARRSFRSGESEYLNNGQRVRLKDVLLLLAQARIGHDSYTVIGQGQIDQALSLRAEERRALFEDAAGIRQFQTQRNEAEQKLTLTQSNLARLRDIVGEIEPRLGPLAEQARRAREFTGAHDELIRMLRVWYRRQWRDLRLAREKAEATEAEQSARIEGLRASLAQADEATRELRDEREALLGEIGARRRERGETSGRLQTTERDLAVGRERQASLERQQAEQEAEQEEQNETIAVAQAHIGALEAQTAAAEDEADRAAEAVATLESDQHAARQTQEREEARLRAAQRDVIQMQARLGAAQTELGRLHKQLGERTRALATRHETTATAQRTLETASAQLEQRREAFEQTRAHVEEIAAQREQFAQEIATGQSEIETTRAAVADADRDRRAASDRLALLEEWRRTLEGYGDGVRSLLNAPADERPPMLGVISQIISAPPGLEMALEAALGVFAQAVLVASEQDAHHAATWLRERGGGHAIFVWQDGRIQQPPHNASQKHPEPDGVATFGYARDVLLCPTEARPALATLLGDTYIVRDLQGSLPPSQPLPSEAGEEQRHRAPISHISENERGSIPLVTLDGELSHPQGWLRGGIAIHHAAALTATPTAEAKAKKLASPAHTVQDESRIGASTLARERELRQLPAEIERLAHEIDERRAQHETAIVSQRERQQQDERLKRDAQRLEAHGQELARAVAAVQREQERAQGEVNLSAAMAEQLAAEIEGFEQEVIATQERVTEQERAQLEANERIEDIQAEVDELLADTRSQQEELTRARTALALKRQEAKTLGQRAEQLRAQSREVEAQAARRADRLRNIQWQRDQLGETLSAQEAEAETLRERISTLGEELRAREDRQSSLEHDLNTLERSQSAEREELARLEGAFQRSASEAQRARDAIEALATQIREELGDADRQDDNGEADTLLRLIGVDEKPHDASAPHPDEADEPDESEKLTPEDLTKLRRQIDHLRARLRGLGGYDPEAPQLYEELKTRFDFLSGQIRDMEQASINLRAIIAELDATMRRQFVETFHAVNERFQRHFTTLFSGGAARLELTTPRREQDDEDDESEISETHGTPRRTNFGGVEVFVQIPGKRVQDLSLLSGGERAMVSAALLFALLETNPPPFCLLDEVDAALDEANVVRFCDILKTLAEGTQFIVITHNRVTMTNADTIYGVSMGPDSVSRLLSMRLSEAAAHAR